MQKIDFIKKASNTAAIVTAGAVLGLGGLFGSTANAVQLLNESFTGVSTPSNAWISGGAASSEKACLTAATTSATGSIPACVGGPFDADGDGYLRLTNDQTTQSGFAIYDTPISATAGLDIQFTMHQYGGTSADGISFFLVDGASNPTEPGAYGGSLGYASDSVLSAPGIVGGYVGIGFDVFGNFSAPTFGTGGPGVTPNAIVVRGSEATNYQYVNGVVASSSLHGTNRTDSARDIRILVDTDSVMSVMVDYGSGYVTELANIDLKTINGNTMPSTFKLGFAASTGGQTDFHEIRMLSVNSLQPNVSVSVSHSGTLGIGDTAPFYVNVSNDANAADTTGSITTSTTLPEGIVPVSASGNGWTCTITGQTVDCTTSTALPAGSSLPVITIQTRVDSVPTSTTVLSNVTAANNANPSPQDTDTVSVVTAAPNTGIAQASPATAIISTLAGMGIVGYVVARRKNLIQ
ncbi:hypothetical protein CR970_03905 [Candidatus Saccharibacteria bacterium]|nr:MAG: hypothetical protein CR970_03905 [Candidatus Saccharibacteria bacterium]